ncbi:serine protease [Sphaerisporangium krabiense]|uniref:Subtilisin family serine protease n=1 Tax=Sphaerisporangium krabiense TaxID=763782 RepID=A0A7W8ZB90_9ACTN|nr:S8 family serine peptidase [Sphaerisporangium krabiense]MBB5630523.1 subtilisin family serine protease [Sphaerisporangium krabiense]GII62522.1 serine protease [Sphaerisporangium krabiense]
MKRKAATIALAATTVLGVMAVPSAAATAAAAARPGPARGLGSVTLITGDRVTVSGAKGGPRAYQVAPGAGRKVSFSIREIAGHTYVVPSDAAALVGRGLVDRRLFDVTQLLNWKYDDAHRADIPIMTQGGAAPKAARAGRAMDAAGLSAARVPKAQAASVWKDLKPAAGARSLTAGVTKLWLDGKLSFSLDKSVPQIGAPEAWAKGLTGKGVTVAVLDSGFDPDHPDLKGVISQSANFSDEPNTDDLVGHGTHVASIVAGSGQASGGKYKGVAPDAKIAFGKVGGEYGIDESDLIAGMEWAATEVKARAVNVSIGGPDGRDLDPVEQAVNTLSEETGTLFVIAAGNDGPRSIGSPGSADAALTVGAVDKNDALADFSSQGPRVGDGAVKPDITAPGVDITAANAGGAPANPYAAHSGTSMATPHVVGAAAILAQRHPDWNGARLKAALISSAKPREGLNPYQQGAGRVDVARAVTQTVVADTPNLWTFVRWPGGGPAVTKELTYANTSDAPVDLALAEDGPYTLSAGHLAVPAGGKASVTLTLDSGLKPGTYPGTVTATAGDVTVRSLAGAYVEPESYDVTVTATGRDGRPLDDAWVTLYDLKSGGFEDVRFSNGAGKIRLQRGEWNLTADLLEGDDYTFTHRAVTVGTRDLTVALDARQGKQVRFSLDDPAAKGDGIYQIGLRRKEGDNSYENVFTASGNPSLRVFALPSRQAGLEYLARTALTSGGAEPSRYDLVDYRAGQIPADPGGRFKKAQLARIDTTLRAQNVNAAAEFDRSVGMPNAEFAVLGATSAPVTVPSTLHSYVTPGHDLDWFAGFAHTVDGYYTSLDFSGRTVRRGHTSEVWNAAVTGPSAQTALRFQDELVYIADGLFSDVAPRSGWDGNITGKASLTGDGKVLQEIGLEDCDFPGQCALQATVPAGAASYTVNVSARRDVPYSTLATALDASWTFRSAHTDEYATLSLPAVRYAPAGLDASNRAAPGSVTRIPVTVDGGTLTTLTVEASFDDGKTWRALQLRRDGKGWSTSVTNPSSPGFVSLRATGEGPDGVQVKQTITRAYAVQR